MKIYDLKYNAHAPAGIENRHAHIVGGGIAGLSAAVYLVDDIHTLYDELRARERPQDAKFRLCDLLCENFDLLMNNYDEFKKLGNGISAIDNPVIDIIYRRIRNIFETTPEPDDYESCIANMRERIKASQPNNR